MSSKQQVLALSGGIGGAKLALGLYRVLDDYHLTVLCNSGDDFEHFGVTISPDIDTVIYTLAGVANPETGWGLEGESWRFMQALADLNGETWFNLGDRDLATHVFRSERLKAGDTQAEICEQLTERFGVCASIMPAANEPVRTTVHTTEGSLPFQHYFVREACAPTVTGFEFVGATSATPDTRLLERLASDEFNAIVICPSNPFISIDPVLAVPGVRDALMASQAPVIAISPIIAGDAVKGPTAKMMRELDIEVSPVSVASHYGDLLDGFIVDQRDEAIIDRIAAQQPSLMTRSTQIWMNSEEDKIALAQFVLIMAEELNT